MAVKTYDKWSVSKMIKFTLLAVFIIIVLIHLIHALTLDRRVEYVEIFFTSPKIPAEMDGYRIAFVTDIHLEFEGRLRGVVDELNERQIDLLLLGGDFTSYSEDLNDTLELLSQITTVDGAFGVEGNHDHYETLFSTMIAYDITPLSNSGVFIRDKFYLAGVEDLWNRSPNIEEAIADAGADSFVLLISHNPDLAMKQDTTGVDLILSGHTHGGQLNFFGRWSIGLDSGIISEYGTKFRSGWAESNDGTPVFVSQGVGEYYPRVFARPQVILITLAAEK